MNAETLEAVLGRLPDLRIGVVGDYCLDAYWTIDSSASEPSVETGLPTQPVRRQRYSPGGAGTVAANLAAMGVGRVHAFGVLGDDPFGDAMRRLLVEQRVDVTGLLTQTDEWDTPVYAKPIRDVTEMNRVDFGNFNRLQDGVALALRARVEAALPGLDGLIVNQQLLHGVHTPFLQSELNALMARHPEQLIIVDSRHCPEHYTDCLHKLNAREAARIAGRSYGAEEVINQSEVEGYARDLQARWGRPVFVTNGPRGCVVAEGGRVQVVSGLHIVRRTDPVGAGDSLLAGVTVALACGETPLEAATFGNFVAGVTVQKLFQTGTASPDEIRAIGASPDYVYQPELADDPRRARFVDGANIEIVESVPANLRLTHAIFDHDGTLSTLREGWEQVMEPVMIRAILGAQYASAGETLYARVVARVREFIDKTTGIQTLVQMQGLVELVKEFGVVPDAERLDEHGYKRIYNEALMGLVRERVARLGRGELDVSDFAIKKAPEFLRRLRAGGVKLYLASGTDEQDVIQEATVMGYADGFEGRIYGATGDTAVEAKRVVLDRILKDIGAANVHQLVTFGDGPVEIRESRKRGGLAVGVASDEVRRFGSNAAKRGRLIRAGAHLVVPDFSQLDTLLKVLRVVGA
ncbi:MAG: carbohydrate kinase [Lentisphaerae bacterium]|nr:carbohydrate kinase [Lentisphaerota bacterium]